VGPDIANYIQTQVQNCRNHNIDRRAGESHPGVSRHSLARCSSLNAATPPPVGRACSIGALNSLLTGPQNGALLIEPDEVTVTILDDDTTTPEITLSALPATIPEDGGIAIFTATLDPASSEIVEVYPSMLNGSASWQQSPVADFYASSGAFTFAPGATTSEIRITAQDDSVSDNSETIGLLLSSSGVAAGAVTIGSPDSASVTVSESTVPSVTLSIDDTTIAETGGVANVTATLSGTSASETIVTVANRAGGATLSIDYGVGSFLITIPAGNLDSSTDITALTDTLDETNEEVDTYIVETTGNVTWDGDEQVDATITDDDATPTVTLSLDDTTLAEASGVGTITATLSAASGQEVTVNLAYTGTATHVSDYVRSTTAITIKPPFTTATAKLTAQQDLVNDDAETITVDISSVVNATESGTQQVEATITDDDLITILDPCEGGVLRRTKCFFGKTWKSWWL